MDSPSAKPPAPGDASQHAAASMPGQPPPQPTNAGHARAADAKRANPQQASFPRPRLPFRARPTSPIAGETQPYRGTPQHVVLSAILLTIALTAIMVIPFQPGEDRAQAGMPAAQDAFSPTYLKFESKVLTERARDDARHAAANEVWVQDSDVVQRQRSILLNNLSVVDAIRNNDDPSAGSKRQRLGSMQDTSLTQAQMDTLLGLADPEYRYWRDNAVLPTFDAVMKSRRVTSPADLQAARAALPDTLVPSLSADEKSAAVAFISPRLAVNVTLDAEQTNGRREEAASAVKPVVVTVQKGEAVLRQGELITPEAVEKMQEAGLLSKELSPQSVLGTAGLVALLMLLLHIYIFRNAPLVWKRQKQLILVGLLLIVTVGMARLILPGHTLLPYLLPVAGVSMLIAVLLSADLAVLVTVVTSVLLGTMLSSGLTMELPIYYFVGGLTAIFSLTRLERVSTFARAGFFIAVASFATAVILKVLLGGALDWYTVGMLLLAALFNGGVATSVTYAAFSLLGTLFGITTPLQLMELAHPDQPLLRRLMIEAPGTYHHSLVVSNLAERAAEMIGADALLTRVCAYYHDIGKVERPHHFIDNQTGMANVHDQLDPQSSAQIIVSHVLDGVKLGQKHRLPHRVLDAIPQHHGTMLIKFFYYKALKLDPTLSQESFRYPGPRPQTKENAILMLADGVEATVRSMAQSGALDKIAAGNSEANEGPLAYSDASSLPVDAIASVVHKTISERIEDGQLDECDLTVRDIARIQEAFVSMLKGIYHPRVAYPEPPRALPSTEYRVPSTEPLEKAATPTMQVAQTQLPHVEIAGGTGV